MVISWQVIYRVKYRIYFSGFIVMALNALLGVCCVFVRERETEKIRVSTVCKLSQERMMFNVQKNLANMNY